MADEWKAICKDCGNEFGYSNSFYQTIRDRGLSRPERCSKCRIQHSKEIGTLGLSHYELHPTLQADGGSVLEAGFLGALYHPTRLHELEEVPPSFDLSDFTITDEGVRELFSLMRRHQVTVVVGPTGSGKSTLLPYRLMIPPLGEEPDTFTRHGQIVVTQPRIAATTSIPKFVASRLYGSNLGVGYDVGFRYSGERATDWRNKLVYITDGTLINWIVADQLGKLSVIVIDEAHERSLNIDLILGLLKARLPRYPFLKLVVASATIDAEKFVSYYANVSRDQIKEEVSAGSRLTDIADRYGVGYIEFKGKEPPWLLEVKVKPPVDPYGGLRYETRFRESDPIPLNRWSTQMSSLMATKVCEILKAMEKGEEVQGDVLGFLHGKRPIEDACRRIKEFVEDDERLVGKIDVFPLYAELTQPEQRAAYGPKKELNRRRVVISTNVAETSLTVEGVVHVVDSGLINETRWDPAIHTSIVLPTVHSQAGCKQRWGRSGRVRHGIVHCLYTEQQFLSEFPQYTVPGILRAPLEQVVLTAKAAGIDDLIKFDWLERPSPAELTRSSRSLNQRGALDPEADLTEHGFELYGFTEHPDIANLIVLADRLACAVEMATLLAMTKAGGRHTLLRWNRDWDATTKRQVNRTHCGLLGPCQDDIELYLKLYEGWAGDPTDKGHKPSEWAQLNYVNHTVFEKKVKPEREKLLRPLTGHKTNEDRRRISFDLLTRLRMLLVYGLPDRIYLLEASANMTSPDLDNFSYGAFSATDDGVSDGEAAVSAIKVEINPDSVCYGKAVEGFVCLQKRLVRRRLSPLAEPELIIFASCLALIKPDWLSCVGKPILTFVRMVARETREASGDLRLTADRARLFLDQFYRIGSTFSCRRLDAPGESDERQLVILEERLSAPVPLIEVTRDEEIEELPDIEEEDVEAEVARIESASNEPIVETTEIEEEAEQSWSNLTEEGAGDIEDQMESQLLGLTDEAGQRVKAVGSLRLDGREIPSEEYFSVVVEGIDFTDLQHPAVEVRLPYSEHPFQAFMRQHQVADDINVTVRAVEKYPNDYLTYLLVEHRETGHEIMMEPEDISLVGRNFAVELLSPGDTFKCVIEQMNAERERIRITRLKEAEEEFLRFRSRNSEQIVDGKVCEIGYGGGVYVMLEPDNEQLKVPIGAFTSLDYLPSKPEITMLGSQCRVKVRFNERKIWRRQLPFVPENLADLLDRRGWINRVTLDEDKHVLSVTGRMTYEQRLGLLALSTNTAFQRTINWIYRRSNSLRAEILDLDSLKTLAEAQKSSSRIKVKVTKIETYGVFVELESGVQGLVRSNEIWSSARDGLRVGEDVEVLVKNIDVERAQVELSMRLPENDPWSNYEVGMEVQVTVTGIQDYGAFVELEPGVKGLIHITDLAWTRIGQVEDVVRVGERVTALITKKDDAKREMALSLRGESNDPQVVYATGAWYPATVVNIQDYGAFLALGRGHVGFVHVSDLSYDHVDAVNNLVTIDQQLDVRVVTIEFKNGYYEINLSLKDYESNPYRSYYPGMTLDGVVQVLRDSGVVLQLDKKGTGFIPTTELSWLPVRRPQDAVSIGERLSAVVFSVSADAEELVLSKRSLEKDPFSVYRENQEVRGEVTGIQPYGVFVELAPGISGLIHRNEMSWTRFNRIEDIVSVGDHLTVRIIRKDDSKRELSLSRRLESEKPEELYPVGSWHLGRIVNIQDYGAFVEVGNGVTGFVHIRDVSFDNITNPGQVLSLDEDVRVRILRLEIKDNNYDLIFSLKDPETSPYRGYRKGARLRGRVCSVEDFGAFIQLDKGGVGLIPARELSWMRIHHPSEAVSVDESFEVEVVSVNEQKEELILSKRAVEEHPFSRYYRGMELQGTVAGIQDYGAFVEIDRGGTGLIPIAELSWEYVGHPSEIVYEGQRVTVKVLSVDVNANRLSLTLKLPETHWIRKYRSNSVVNGLVTNIQDRGVVVKLPEGGSGWLHISELSWRRVEHPTEVIAEGEQVRVLIKNIDDQKMKIELSLKALQAKPVLSVGQILWGRVSKIESFGAFVDLGEYGSGLVHISQMSYAYVNHPTEVVHVGQTVRVLVMETSPKVKLSIKQAQ